MRTCDGVRVGVRVCDRRRGATAGHPDDAAFAVPWAMAARVGWRLKRRFGHIVARSCISYTVE